MIVAPGTEPVPETRNSPLFQRAEPIVTESVTAWGVAMTIVDSALASVPATAFTVKPYSLPAVRPVTVWVRAVVSAGCVARAWSRS